MPVPDREGSKIEKLNLRVSSASSILSSKIQQYCALLMVGSPSQREAARCDAMDAAEALLDLQELHMSALLNSLGIDPQYRHLNLED